jgi:hypothetical protein
MSKIFFKYIKEDGSVSDRELLQPKFLKESYNVYDDFNKPNVNYVQGYEVDKENMSFEEIKEYEDAINDYYELVAKSLNEYLVENDLDPNKLKYKTFKKSNIKDLELL